MSKSYGNTIEIFGDEKAGEITARVGAASFDETHVMDENQRSESFRALKYRMLNDV